MSFKVSADYTPVNYESTDAPDLVNGALKENNDALKAALEELSVTGVLDVENGGTGASALGDALAVNGDELNVSDMTGASATIAGTHGLVPQPMAGDEGKFLTGAGSWEEAGSAYELPVATADTLGGVKVGDGLSVSEDGTLSLL